MTHFPSNEPTNLAAFLSLGSPFCADQFIFLDCGLCAPRLRFFGYSCLRVECREAHEEYCNPECRSWRCQWCFVVGWLKGSVGLDWFRWCYANLGGQISCLMKDSSSIIIRHLKETRELNYIVPHEMRTRYSEKRLTCADSTDTNK
jgi:hypothetical protein